MSEPLMTIGELAQALGPEASVKGASGIKFSSVEIDSRKVQPNGLFFAIEGERDGHDFVQDAADNGAAAAVVSHIVPVSIPQVVVPDTRKALLESASLWRKRFSLPVIAVAGSNGKTTTTQMILSIISNRYEPAQWIGTLGNLNNDMGVALMLWRLRSHHQVAAFEIGMNHVGEMEALVKAVAPTVSVVTNTMRDHQEFLLSMEDTARENGLVYEMLPPNGVAVINEADPYCNLWHEQAGPRRIVSFGTPCSDVSGEKIDKGFRLITPSGEIDIALNVLGDHNIVNAVCAAAVEYAVGRELCDIKKGLENFRPVAHRGETFKLKDGSLLIDDSYNANPDSMIAALKMLAANEMPTLAILGDMGELGVQSVDCHKEIGKYAADVGIQTLFCTGNRMIDAVESFGPGAKHFENKEELLEAVLELLNSGPHAILIKASNFMKLYNIAAKLEEKVGKE